MSSDYGETVSLPWLLAADGARSTVRDEMKIPFEGSTFGEEWHLADLPLITSLAIDFAHVFFIGEGGFLFAIRVVEGKENARTKSGTTADDPPVWRVMGSVPVTVTRKEALSRDDVATTPRPDGKPPAMLGLRS